ncbi:CRISPR-associated protein Csx14 [[Luteovulum] sphaeroides subsp. megalophilum]|uniref:hypothetical protein n=1 Tax=Cereibacter sphaeroides TaxID=1063 RepID=UPI000B6F71C6|nr:hypothetical protein [Cereibacter sphaeroides]SNT37424.1 CRISPR-associated protein Csx14 [[Luteovulum] sphaeroides subsp. megalophilum]
MVGYPVVELLAVNGLRYARPAREHRLSYRCTVWEDLLPFIKDVEALLLATPWSPIGQA